MKARRFRSFLFAACVSVSSTAWHVSPCHAQTTQPSEEEQAASLFADAERAFADRDYASAAALFLRADEKAPHASVMYNAAVSWDYAGDRARAADSYQTALERDGLTPQQQAQAEKRLDELGQDLGLVHVAKPVGGLASIDRIERRPIPFQFFLEPGSYQVELETATGAETTTDITVIPGQTLRLELNPVENTVVPVVTNPVPPRSTDVFTEPKPAPQPEPSPNRTQEIVGWIGLGVGVIAAGTATYWGLQTLEKRDAYEDSGYTDERALRDGEGLRTRTNVAWASSALTSAAGLTLVLTSPTFRF